MKNELEITKTWQLYENGKKYLSVKGIYQQTDQNQRYYIGDQWSDQKKQPNTPLPVMNIIKPACDYKIGAVAQHNISITYSSENFDNPELKVVADKYMEMINENAKRNWENDNMDSEMWKYIKSNCVDGTTFAYKYKNDDDKTVTEKVLTSNIYMSDENDDDIQNQEYILITFRRLVDQVRAEAKVNGISDSDIELITSDENTNDTTVGNKEEVKTELGKCLCILKLYKKETTIEEKETRIVIDELGNEVEQEVVIDTKKVKTVHMIKSTRNVEYVKETDLKIKLYPVAYMSWEEEENSLRGRGLPQSMIANQQELNKTIARRLITAQLTAYPKPVYLEDKISNIGAIKEVGTGIGIKGKEIVDVRNAFTYLNPAQMSPDVKQIYEELKTDTKELVGAGDIALGNVNPEQASGRAILAVQGASQVSINVYKAKFSRFVEDLARIDLDFYQNTLVDGMQVIVKELQEDGTEKEIAKKIPYEVIQKINASVRVDISPSTPYDKFAKEQTLENYFTNGAITFEELVKALPKDSVAPKGIFEEILADRKKKEEEFLTMQQDTEDKMAMLQGMQQQEVQDNGFNALEQDTIAKQQQVQEILGGMR